MNSPLVYFYPTSYMRWNADVLEQWWSPMLSDQGGLTSPDKPEGQHGAGEWRPVPRA